LWIDVAREFGDPVPVPKGRRLMLASFKHIFVQTKGGVKCSRKAFLQVLRRCCSAWYWRDAEKKG
jgi:hypothetical protein